MWGVPAMLMTVIALGAAPREGPLRVLVLVDGDREQQLASRIEGQTTDLPAEVTSEELPAGLTSDAKASTARAQASARGAEVLVWFEAVGDGWIVNVAHGAHTLTRRVEESSGAMSASASTEAVALVVRTALRGIAVGEPPPPSEPVPPPPPLRVWGELGWAVLLDREGSQGHHGGEARLGLGVGPWRFGLEADYHPAQRLASNLVTIEVERQSFGLLASLDVAGGGRWRLSGELGAAALRFPRTTTFVAEGYSPLAAHSSWSPSVRPAVSFSFRLVWALWVSATLGADVVFDRPEFLVQQGVVFTRLATLWVVEPRASLTLVIDML